MAVPNKEESHGVSQWHWHEMDLQCMLSATKFLTAVRTWRSNVTNSSQARSWKNFLFTNVWHWFEKRMAERKERER